jgi:MATE family multidrug resistance protein
MIFGMGILTGLDYLISHSHGAGKSEEGHLCWSQGFWVSWLIGIPMTALLYLLSCHLDWLGLNSEVIGPSREYLSLLSFSLIPVYLFTASRQYLQAMGHARPAAVVLIVANVVNALANWAFVLGHFGFAAAGARGSAQATLVARLFMFFAMLGVHFYYDQSRHGYFKKFGVPLLRDPMKRLMRLGIPSALQMTFEVGGFAFSTTLAARLAAEALAAHQIVLNIASITFMVPLGISSATAVLVGREMGKGAPQEATRVGWKGLGLGVGFMALSGVCLLLFSTYIIEIYTTDMEIRKLAAEILLIAALFQLSDGAQTVATGALRGLADTRTPMLANLLGHWGVGIPIGITLCFFRGQGLVGLWTGLALGLTAVAALLLARWVQLTRKSVSAIYSE